MPAFEIYLDPKRWGGFLPPTPSTSSFPHLPPRFEPHNFSPKFLSFPPNPSASASPPPQKGLSFHQTPKLLHSESPHIYCAGQHYSTPKPSIISPSKLGFPADQRHTGYLIYLNSVAISTNLTGCPFSPFGPAGPALPLAPRRPGSPSSPSRPGVPFLPCKT